MLRVIYSGRFLKASRQLPRETQTKLAYLIPILQENPFQPRLHTKPLAGHLTGFYSFRITRDFRVIFKFLDPETIRLVEVAHRKEAYQK